jgi:hypothetical protein
MDLLLRLVTARNLGFVVLAVGLGGLLLKEAPRAKKVVDEKLYPPVAQENKVPPDIERDAARKRALHVRALAANADALVEAARRRGDDVRALDAKRAAASKAAAANDLKLAAELLNQMIGETPAAPIGMIPIDKHEMDEEEIEEDLAGKGTAELVDSGLGPAPKKRAKRRAR